VRRNELPLCAIRVLTRRSKKHRYSMTFVGAEEV
jgi:hypothetical protein